jgi:hypothetical protein
MVPDDLVARGGDVILEPLDGRQLGIVTAEVQDFGLYLLYAFLYFTD